MLLLSIAFGSVKCIQYYTVVWILHVDVTNDNLTIVLSFVGKKRTRLLGTALDTCTFETCKENEAWGRAVLWRSLTGCRMFVFALPFSMHPWLSPAILTLTWNVMMTLTLVVSLNIWLRTDCNRETDSNSWSRCQDSQWSSQSHRWSHWSRNGLSDHRLLQWTSTLDRPSPVYRTTTGRPWQSIDNDNFTNPLCQSAISNIKSSAFAEPAINVEKMCDLYACRAEAKLKFTAKLEAMSVFKNTVDNIQQDIQMIKSVTQTTTRDVTVRPEPVTWPSIADSTKAQVELILRTVSSASLKSLCMV